MTPNHDAATRAQVVTLKACGFTNAQITSKTGISGGTIRGIYARAIERGFDLNANPSIITNDYVAEASRSGRPTKQIKENK